MSTPAFHGGGDLDAGEPDSRDAAVQAGRGGAKGAVPDAQAVREDFDIVFYFRWPRSDVGLVDNPDSMALIELAPGMDWASTTPPLKVSASIHFLRFTTCSLT